MSILCSTYHGLFNCTPFGCVVSSHPLSPQTPAHSYLQSSAPRTCLCSTAVSGCLVSPLHTLPAPNRHQGTISISSFLELWLRAKLGWMELWEHPPIGRARTALHHLGLEGTNAEEAPHHGPAHGMRLDQPSALDSPAVGKGAREIL